MFHFSPFTFDIAPGLFDQNERLLMTVDRVWHILAKKLNGEASGEELDELSQILSLHPELHYPIQSISDLWNLDKQDDKQEAINALQKHLLRLADNDGEIKLYDAQPYEKKTGSSSRKIKYVFYALTAVVLSVGFYHFLHINKAKSLTVLPVKSTDNNVKEIITKAGFHSKVILPDSSVVWLNGGSRLTYDKAFNQALREVELTGEAFFDVAKNPAKPFIIHTRQMDIKVLGTAFNVKSYPEDNSSETSLIHGTIEVTMHQGAGEKIILKPKDKLIVTGYYARLAEAGQPGVKASSSTSSKISSISYLPLDSTIIETSWVDNRLIFRDRSFIDLSAEMERKYGVVFRFQNDEAKQLMFNGNFKNESITQALEALQLANKFSYTLVNDSVYIFK